VRRKSSIFFIQVLNNASSSDQLVWMRFNSTVGKLPRRTTPRPIVATIVLQFLRLLSHSAHKNMAFMVACFYCNPGMAKQGLVTEIKPKSPADPEKEESRSERSKDTIPVVEEKAKVTKEVVDVSKVRLLKTVENAIENVDVSTAEEHVEIKRVPKNVIVDTVPEGVRYEGDVMIIPVLKEVAVVEKKIMLVEEIHVSRHTTRAKKTVEVPVRKEKIEAERIPLRKDDPNSLA
jgi:stress response protein YsnF